MEDLRKALFASIPALVGVLATGLLGAGLTFLWNVQLKERELNLAASRRLHDLYGEFFAVWKLWNYYIGDIGTHVGPAFFPQASRWELLKRACAAEAGIEALLIELSSSRNLKPTAIEDLGKFRQVWQQLRESIRDDHALDWNYSEHPAYMAFKQLAPRVANLVRTGENTQGKTAQQRASVWPEITSGKFAKWWLDKQ